ncbi:hypothetical protein REPUB_Repub01dG0086800 [Reevesia pubescens]
MEATLEEIDYSTSEIWVEVHNLPLVYLTRNNAVKISFVFPEMIELDFEDDEEIKWSGVLRMKISFKVNELLKTISTSKKTTSLP